MQVLPALPNARLKCARAACPLKRSVCIWGNFLNKAGKSLGRGKEILPSKLPARSHMANASQRPIPRFKSVFILSA